MPEEKLLKDLRKGHEEAYIKLIDIYGDRILQVAYFYLKNREKAEDICQEVFITVFKQIKIFKGNSSLYTWIYRITVNKCYDYNRLKNNQTLSIDELSPENFFTENTSTDEQVLESLRLDMVRSALAKLDFTYREVLFFFYFQNLKIEEIANILDCRIGTIKSRLSRGRQKLKDILIEEGFTNE